MVLKQINSKTRVSLSKFYFPALSSCIMLERKITRFGFSFWVVVSWIYPSCLPLKDLDYAIQWFFWERKYNSRKNNSEYQKGLSFLQ